MVKSMLTITLARSGSCDYAIMKTSHCKVLADEHWWIALKPPNRQSKLPAKIYGHMAYQHDQSCNQYESLHCDTSPPCAPFPGVVTRGKVKVNTNDPL